MLLTHSTLLSSDELISAMHSGMWGIFVPNTGEGSSEAAPKTGYSETPNAPSPTALGHQIEQGACHGVEQSCGERGYRLQAEEMCLVSPSYGVGYGSGVAGVVPCLLHRKAHSPVYESLHQFHQCSGGSGG